MRSIILIYRLGLFIAVIIFRFFIVTFYFLLPKTRGAQGLKGLNLLR